MAVNKKGKKPAKKMVKRKKSPPRPISLDRVPQMLEDIRKGLALRYAELEAEQKAYEKTFKGELAEVEKRRGKKMKTPQHDEMKESDKVWIVLGFVSRGIHVDCDLDSDDLDDDEDDLDIPC